ncbi:MAG TPA: beta-ketoacyl synthase N-terminal-like domain-containing protein [Thermoanaerobaculia bacterium]|nr:beta-ketoacyl synthase N-terminal-like domain-containing protein [Thermoanaerobaculia bacterium]
MSETLNEVLEPDRGELDEPLDGELQERVAVVGFAGRFPGAPDAERFWDNLVAGRESLTAFTDEELLAAGVPPETLADPRYVKAGMVLDGIEELDADFFGLSPQEAAITDPQHRLLLECAHAALEHAAYDPGSEEGWVGVFAGTVLSTYLLFNLFERRSGSPTGRWWWPTARTPWPRASPTSSAWAGRR